MRPSIRSAGVGIVTEAFARRYFGTGSAVGRQVSMRRSKDIDAPLTIVGVVADIAYRHVREPMKPIVFVPMGTASGLGRCSVETAGDPMSLGTAVARLLRPRMARGARCARCARRWISSRHRWWSSGCSLA